MADRGQKVIGVAFYRSENGTEPVRDWLGGLTRTDRRRVGATIKTVEYAWPIGMPVVKPISGRAKLWEVRSSISDGRIARVLFTVIQERMILLHAFIKKAQKIPERELAIAERRKRRVRKLQR